MKKFLKNPLKVVVAGLFALAVSVGLSTGLSVGESDSNVDLLALSSAVAQSESGFPCGTCKGSPYYCGGYQGGPCGVKYMSIK